MKKAGATIAIVVIFLVPLVGSPNVEDGLPYLARPTYGGNNFLPSGWQDSDSGYGKPLSGTLNGFKVSSGTSVLDYSHSAYIGIDPPLGWSSDQLDAQLDHLSIWVDGVLANPNLDAYHSERWLQTSRPDDTFLIPDGWTYIKNDAPPSGTGHPQHGNFEVNGVSGTGYDSTMGWRFDANYGSTAVFDPTNGMYMSQQISAPWREVYSAEITFRYYVSSVSNLDDMIFVFTRLEDYVTKFHVFESVTPIDTWLEAKATIPSSYFQSIEIQNALLFDIGLGTDMIGNPPGAAVHEIFIDEIDLRFLVRPFPEEIDLRANGAIITGSTQGSVSPYVPDGSNRDCYSGDTSNWGAGGVDLNGYDDNGYIDVGNDLLTPGDWTSADPYSVGLQFPLHVPQGSTISSAILQVEAAFDATGNPGVRIYIADEDDVTAFTTGYPLLQDRYDWVNTSIYWRPTTWLANGRYDSPDVSALIQEVVSRPGWQSGNYICIMIDYAYSTSDYEYYNIKGSSGYLQADLARLFVDFTSPDPSDTIPSFRYNKNLVIDHTRVVSDLQNFPVLVDIWDEDLHIDVQPDGDDIAFLYNDQIIPHELELFDKKGNGTHAHLVCWVNVPYLSSIEDTTLVMVYGDEDLGSQEDPLNVWDSGYSAVWHLNDDPAQPQWDSTSADYLPHQPQIVDSTLLGLDGSTYGTMTSSDSVSGQFGNAIDLEGVNDYIDFGNPAELQITGAITVESWFKADFIDNDYLVVKSAENNFRGWDLSFDVDSSISPAGWVMFRFSPDGVSTTSIGYERVETGQWYHVVGVFQPSLYARFYLNGELVDQITTGTPASMNDPNRPFRIGRRSDNPGGTSYFDGIVDEVRVSTVARSDAWIRTQYNNQRNPGLFLTVGEEGVNFRYMKDITIDHNKVASDLTGFPVLIDIYDSDLHKDVQPDGDDIMFTSNGRSLPHEIELFDQQYNSTHAHLVAWVRMDLSSTTDTVLSMFYSNPSMGSQENPVGVWSYTYAGVWHLGDTSGNALDSTAHDNDGIPLGGVTQGASGKIGNANDVDGIDDSINFGNPADRDLDFGANDLTFSIWVFFDGGTGYYQDIIYKGSTGLTDPGYSLATNTAATKTEALVNDGVDRISSTYVDFTLNAWIYYAVTVDRSDNLMRYYMDGNLIATPVDVSMVDDITSIRDLQISRDSAPVNGSLDEFRLSYVARSPAWILTEYNNQFDPSSFYSLGVEQEVIIPKKVPLEFMYKKDIIIDHTKVASDLYGFPVLIDLYDADLRFDVQADGDDIVFVKDGWILPHEIELFDQSYNSSHGHLIAWVRADLSASTDTVLSMYYGDSSSESQENPNGVWDTSFAAVWHLSEDPAGTVYDSTANGNDGIGYPLGSEPTLQTGKIDGCSEFYGEATNDRIEAPHSSSLVLPSDMLVEAWVRTNNIDGSSDAIVAKWGDVGHRNYWLGKLDSSTLAFYVDDTQSVTTSLSWVNDGQWHHVAGVANADTGELRLYVDGVERGNAAYTGSTQTGTSVIHIANNPGSVGFIQEWDGRIDEVRVSNSYRNLGWIVTEFNNQNDPSSFYAVEIETTTAVTYEYSRQVTITSGSELVPAGYTTSVTIDHASLVAAGKSQIDGDDLRIMYWNGLSLTELDRILDFDSSWNSATAKIWFRIQTDIPAYSSDDQYFIYYGNPTVTNPPNDYTNVFQFYDGFESGDLSAWDGSYTDTGDTLIVLNTPLIPVHSGTYAVRGDVDDVAAAQAMVWKDFSDKSNLFARVHFYLPAGFSTSDHVTIMQYVDTSAVWQNQLSVTIRDDMTLYMWNDVVDEAYGYGTTSTISTGSWHTLDMQAKISDTVGEARLWLDGNLEIEVTGVNLGTEGIDRFCTVFYWAAPQTEPNTVIADDAFLRPFVSPEPTSIISPEISQDLVFNYKKEISIDHTKVAADLVDFPLLVDIFDSDLQTKTQSDGDDIIFTIGNTILPHELELFNQTYNSTHAHLVAWVKTDLSSTVDTTISMYYGNPGLSNQENPSDVWNSNYVAVWHMNQDPSSSLIKDSTINGYDLTATGFGSDQRVYDGELGTAIAVDGLDDRFSINGISGPVNDFTFQSWFALDSVFPPGSDMHFFRGNSLTNDYPLMRFAASSGLVVTHMEVTSDIDETCTGSKSSWEADTWFQFAWVRSMSAVRAYHYLNGTLDAEDNSADNANPHLTWNQLAILSDLSGGNMWGSGAISEFRILNVSLSPDWIATEYLNQNDPSGFYSVGTEVSMQLIEFDYKKDLTVDHTKVDSDLTDFPLLVDLFDTDLRAKVQIDGDDIIFKLGTTVLPHEIELFDQNYNSTHAHLVAWVKTNLSSTVDTIVTMFYGNPSATNQENQNGVWNDNYWGVWHLGETSGVSRDSVSGGPDGTLMGGPTQGITGRMGYGYDFDGTDDFIALQSSNTQSTGTYSFWVYPVGFPPGPNSEVNFMGADAYLNRISYYNGRIRVETATDAEYFDFPSSSVVADAWQHIVFVRSGDFGDLYINGVWIQQDETVGANTLSVDNIAGTIDLDRMVNGTMDEIRISSIAHSASWITTEYRNQNDPSSFYSIGEETTLRVGYQSRARATDFQYKKDLVVDHAKVATDLTDFPVLIDIFDTDLRNDVQSDGDDIMFRNGQSWCPHEITYFDQTYNATHAHLMVWVKTDLSSSVDTTITMYYGNPDLTAQENPSAVWGNYAGVWHLEETPTGTVYDSSPYNNDGATLGSMSGSALVPGQIGSGFALDGVDDMINVSESSSLDSVKYAGTLSLWINWVDSADGGYQRVMTTSDRFILNPAPPPTLLQDDGFEWAVQPDGDHFFYPWGGNSIDYNLATDPFTNNVWHHLVLTLDYSTKSVIIYLDGAPMILAAENVPTEWTQLASLGDWLWGGNQLDTASRFLGKFDEIRVSTAVQSPGWVITEYNNQNDPSSFLSIGSEVQISGIEYLFTTSSASAVTIGAELTLEVQTSFYTYADDFSLGTTFSIANGSVPVWTTGVLISPPSEIVDISFEISYPDGDWWPLSVTSPSGVEKAYASDWTCFDGRLTVASTAIDEYGMWQIKFLDRNHILDMQIGPSGGPYSSTDQFTLGEDIQFRIRSSWITGSTIALELTDPSGSAWYTGATINQGDRFTLPYYHRKTLTVSHENVAEDLANFPVLIDIYDTDLRTDVRPDGRDIAFAIGEETLSHEIELFDQAYNLTHAHLVAWVKVPLLSCSSDTIISMYYDNPLAPIVYASGPVWDSNYVGVWHLGEIGAGLVDEYADSSLYNNHGQGGDGNVSYVPSRVATRIGYGQDFTDHFIDCGNATSLDITGNQITLQLWMQYPSATHPNMGPFNHKGWYSGYRFTMSQNSQNMRINLGPRPTGGTYDLGTSQTIAPNGWHHVVATYDGSLVKFYIDGSQDAATMEMTTNILSALPDSFRIGHADQPEGKAWTFPWIGQIDEVRISDIARSSAWINTEFENQNNPSVFYSVSSEETSGYSESAPINLDASAPAGVWHASARYSDSSSDVNYRVGTFSRSFIVKRGTSLGLIAPGDAIADGISTKLIGEQLYVEFELKDTLTTAMLSGAEVSMNWSVSGVPTNVQLNDYGDGRYGTTLNTSDLGSYGRWRLDLESSHPFYTNATDFFYLDLSHRTFLTYEPPKDTPYGGNFEVKLTLRDKFDNTPLTGATISCNATILGLPTDYGNGTYLVTIDSTGFSVGEHTFRFTTSPSTSYLLSSNIDVQFNYRGIATEVTPLNPDAVESPWGHQANTSIYWSDVDHAGIGVDGGSISISPFVQTQLNDDGGGYYSLTIDVSSFTPGTYYFNLTFSKQNYQSSMSTISITILAHRTTPSINYNSTIPVGTDAYFDVSWLDLDLYSVSIGGGNLSQVNLDWGTGSDSFPAFSFWLDTSGWAIGSYTINVTINAIGAPRFYMDSYLEIQLEIRKLNVYLSWDPLEPFPNGNDFVMFVYVNVSEPGNPIDGTPITGLDQSYFSATNETGNPYTFESFINLGEGVYQITIDSTRFLEGQYKIKVFVDFLPAENYTDSSTPEVTFSYRPILTYLSSPDYPTVTTSFDTNVTVTLSYVDIDHVQNITIGTITSEGASIVWRHTGNGVYEVLIIVQGWDLGTHEVNLTADANGYQAKTLTFQILVQIAYAYARSSVSIIDLPVGDTAVFYADYWDITHDAPILGATINHNWTYSLSISWTGDQYRIELPSTDTDGLGSYLVMFTFSKGPNYQTGYFNLSIIVRTHLTEFRLASAIEPTSYNAMVNISVYCGDLDNDVGIAEAPIALSVYGDSGLIPATYENDTVLGDGYYIIRFAATNLGSSGIFDLTVYFNWTGPVQKYLNGSLFASIRIIGEASNLELFDSAEPTPYLGNLTYTYVYSELYSGIGISNVSAPAGNVHIYVNFVGYSFNPSLYTITEDSGNPGYYSIMFNSTMFGKPGIYTMIVYVNWSKGVDPGYGNWTDTVSVRIIPRSTVVNLIPPESTPYGVNATFAFSFDDVAEGIAYSVANSSQMTITIGLPDYTITYNESIRQFHVSFNTSILGAPLGARQFSIGVVWTGSPFYTNVTGRNVIISVRFRETEFDYSAISPAPYGDNVTLHVSFTDVTEGASQTIDDGLVTLYNGVQEIPVSEYSFSPLGNGDYEIELKTTYFSNPGTYAITIEMSTSHFYYALVAATRTLSLQYRLTVVLVEPVAETPYNNSLEIVFHYSDVLTLADIGNTSTPTTIKILNGSSWIFSSVWRGASEDYLLTVQTYNQILEINKEYVLWIELSYPDAAPFYLSSEAFISFTLRERTTNLELTSSPEPTQYLEKINFTVYYQDTLSLSGIAGATITLTIGGSDLVEGVDYLLQSPAIGRYSISLNTTSIGPAGTNVNLQLTASWISAPPYYSTSVLSLTLSVTKRNSITEILTSTTLVRYLENVTFTIRYSDDSTGQEILFNKDQLLIYSEGTPLQGNDFSMMYRSPGYEVSINSSILKIGLISSWNITFYIEWQDNVAPYYADGRVSTWVNVVNRVGIVIRESSPTVPIHDNMTLEFRYVDDSTGAGINNAIVLFDCLSPSGLIEGVDFWVFQNNGNYSILVDTTSLGSTGTFTFSLRLLWNPTLEPFYRNTTMLYLQGTVRLIQTQLTNEEPNPSTVPIHDNVSVVLNLQDLDHSSPIIGAEGSFSVTYKTNTSGPSTWSIIPISPGVYELVVDCSDAGVTGTNALTITLSFMDYQTVEIQVPFQIRLRQGELNEIVAPATYYGETTYVIVELVDIDAGYAPIDGAVLTLTWPDIGYTPDYVSIGPGLYNITLTTTSLDSGLYTLVVGAQKSDYFISDVSVPVQILSISTELILPQTIPDVYWGEDVSIWAIFNDTRDNILISGANLEYQFGVLSGSLTEVVTDPGNYTITIDSGNLAVATTYVVSITATLNNYETITGQLTVNVLKLSLELTVVSNTQPEVFKGTPVNITVYVNNTYTNTPLLGATVEVTWVAQGEQSITLSPVPGLDGYYTGFVDTNDLFVQEYVLTVRADRTNYVTATTSVSVKIKQISTVVMLDALTSTYSTRTFNWSDIIRVGVYVLAPSLNVSYPLSTGLANCTVQWSLSGTIFTGEFLNGSLIGGPGYFYFDFNTFDYSASTYTLRITAHPNIGMFAYSSNFTTLIIEPIETSVESTYLSPKIWGWTGWVNLTYWDLLFDRGIAGADVIVDWNGLENTFRYVGNGTYQVFINASLVTPGIYPVSVRFILDNYKIGTGVFTLNVKEVPTAIRVFAPTLNQLDEDALILEVPYGDVLPVVLFYNDTWYNRGIPGATEITGVVIGLEIPERDYILIEEISDGNYSLLFDTSRWIVSDSPYRVILNFYLGNWSRATVEVQITIINVPTGLQVDGSSSLTMSYGKEYTIWVFYYDAWVGHAGEGIAGGSINATPLDTGYVIVSLNQSDSSRPGWYEIRVRSRRTQGSTIVSIILSKDNFESAGVSIAISVEPSEFDILIERVIIYGAPIGFVLLVGAVLWTRLFSIPKRLREIRKMVKTISKGKIPEIPDNVPTRQEIVANLFNDIAGPIGITKTASSIPSEAIPSEVPEIEELLVQLSILSNLTDDELEDFRLDVSKMKLSEQVAFVKEVINQEAIKQGRIERKPMELILAETAAKARAILAGEDIEEVFRPELVMEKAELKIVDEKEESLLEPIEFEEVVSEDMLSDYELKEIRQQLVDAGIKGSELETIMEQARELPKELAEELLKSILGEGGGDK
ncbi:MAG: DUF2341 domain-containing protein [Candidatus Thorarchaeota archaeon]